jgi:hypothetical protein
VIAALTEKRRGEEGNGGSLALDRKSPPFAKAQDGAPSSSIGTRLHTVSTFAAEIPLSISDILSALINSYN